MKTDAKLEIKPKNSTVTLKKNKKQPICTDMRQLVWQNGDAKVH